MTAYKTIKGFTVQSLATDPLTAGIAGATWSSGGNLPATRGSGIGHAGTQTATLAFGGLPGGATLTYNGTSWSAPGVDMNVAARYSLASFGTQTAALACGGDPGATNNGLVEQYDGSSWTEKTEMNTGRSQNPIGAGTVTAGLVGGGNSTVNTETWDGSSWTEVNNLNTNRRNGAGGGIQTSAIYCTGDQNPGLTTNVETWDGTSWTEVNNVNTARLNLSAAFNGGNSEGLIFGGSTPTNSALTEYWDGSSWTELADLGTARKSGGGTGAASSAIFYGGSPGTFTNTEEFTAGGIGDTIKNEGQVYYNTTSNTLKLTKLVLGTGAWSSGGNLNVAKRSGSLGADTNSAATYAGGTNPSGTLATTELYNGSAWTASPQTLNEVRTAQGTIGSSTSMLVVTGNNATAITVNVEEWNGTNWTEKANVNTGRYEGVGGSGTSTSGMIFGGKEPAQSAKTEIYNGSGWTEVSDLNTARARVGASTKGTVTASLCFGGEPNRAITEEWNGSSWTEVADLNTGRQELGGAGVSTNALAYAGYSGSDSALTESWNGTSWTEVADMATARRHGTTGNGSATSAIQASGETTVVVANTEEWTVPATVSNVTVDVD